MAKRCLFLLFWFFLLGNAAVSAQNWSAFQDLEGRFKILTPGSFEKVVDSVQTELGTIAYHTFFHQSQEAETEVMVYMLSFCVYPEGSINSDSTDILSDFFEVTIQAAAESVDGTVIYTDSLEWQGFPARLWRIDYLNEQATIKTMAVLANNRFYTAQVIGPRQKAINPKSRKFLDSLELF